MKMKAAVLRQFSKPASIEKIELAPPKEREVLVKTRYTSFCHSDLHFMQGSFRDFRLPLVLGHEASGVVEEIGPGVTTLKKGDHVVPTWMIPCGECPECRSGRGFLCINSNRLHGMGGLLDGTPRLTDSNGNPCFHEIFVSGFAEYMVIPEKGAIKVREDLPLDQACFLGCCMPTGFGATYNAADIKPGDSVAIWGMGGVGLNVVRGVKSRGANPIIGVDLEGSKEAIAREFGVTHFINSSKEDPVPVIKGLTGMGAKFVFEAAGDIGAHVQAYWSLGPWGRLVQIGVSKPGAAVKADYPITFTPLHCISLKGAIYGLIDTHRDIPIFADMAAKGELKLDRLITKKFRVEEINDVAEAMDKRQIIGRWVCEWD
jgi:S-(hydroxymethyl)glutathione dehydrogenase/alcohol dehydrogenase